MSKDSNQKDGLEIKPGMTVGKATHDEWLQQKSYKGGHSLKDEVVEKSGTTSESGADGAGTGTFNPAVRPVK